MAGVATILPVSASVTTIFPPSQTENSRRCFVSMAIPDGLSAGASGQVAFNVSVLASRATISLLSSKLS